MDTAFSSALPDGSAIFLEKEMSMANDGQSYWKREKSGHGEQIDDEQSATGFVTPKAFTGAIANRELLTKIYGKFTLSTDRPPVADATFIRAIPPRGYSAIPFTSRRLWSTA